MKHFHYKHWLFVALFSVTVLLPFSCNKDEVTGIDKDADIGNPQVHFIRSTDPNAADSLLVGAFMGSLIAIVGEDLGHTVELWFNDQQAALNPTYVTDKTIIVNVPSSVPVEVTNKIRFVFSNGAEMLYDFSVNVPAPVLNSIKSEYVEDGDVAVLYGDFFFEPIHITFPGNLEGEIVVLSKTEAQVRVPAGAESGEITVKTNFGTAVSSFIFRDNRNVIVNFDDLRHRTWNSPIADVAVGTNELAPCAGNYTYFKMDNVSAWQWVNELNMMYIAEDGVTGRGNIPIFPGGASVNEWAVRFEVNVPVEWREIPLEIFFAPYGADHGRDIPVPLERWQPWAENGVYQTDGWVTVTIPLKDFDEDKNGTPAQLSDLSQYTNLTIMLFGAAVDANNIYIAIDNVRVVKL
ncbi:MAG TPA: glycan-binding surface protein [Saprospiraceae bacterium]|nr:glycan-binding surface protein [Saprospiraceae bacterium]HMQ81411.1 glycan-binding surface protein [Saprospiraceae bacterium]